MRVIAGALVLIVSLLLCPGIETSYSCCKPALLPHHVMFRNLECRVRLDSVLRGPSGVTVMVNIS